MPEVKKTDTLELSFSVSEPTAEQVLVIMSHKEHTDVIKTFPAQGPNAGVFAFKLVCVDSVFSP